MASSTKSGELTAAALRRLCLGRPGAVEEFPFGDEVSVFKVAGKMFALSRLRSKPLRVSLKCDPELSHALRGGYPAIQPGYHLNKRHWITVTLDRSITGEMVRSLVEDSYDLVVAKLSAKQRAIAEGRRG